MIVNLWKLNIFSERWKYTTTMYSVISSVHNPQPLKLETKNRFQKHTGHQFNERGVGFYSAIDIRLLIFWYLNRTAILVSLNAISYFFCVGIFKSIFCIVLIFLL